MKISIVQFKSKIGEVEKNLLTAENLIGQAKNSDVIILPELWTTGYYPKPAEKFADLNGEKTSEFVCGLAKKFNVNIIAGSIIAKVEEKIFNRCICVNRSGEISAVYDKVHLFGFADENKVFDAGNKIVTAEVDGVKFGVAICYDIRFPEFIRKISLREIEILFAPAAWSLKRLYPRQILTKARAIENQIFVVFANSAGKSEIINPLGETVAEADNDEQILTADIDLNFRREVIEKMNLFADRHIDLDKI